MELIKDLEQKFQNLDATLNSRAKVYSFYINYNNSYNRINTRIFNESKEKKYENGLNARRDEMLDLLIQKRNEQLEQVNEFNQSSQQNNLPQLKILHKSINQNYTAFAKGLASVYESILFRFKLANPLNLAQLERYKELMRNEVTVSLAKVNKLIDLKSNFNLDSFGVHVFPSNRIFLYCPFERNMVILNKLGDLIGFKALHKDFEYDVKLNATNIVVLNETNRTVDIYNFKLELVYSIILNQSYDYFKLNNYDIAFITDDDPDRFFITCFNFKTAQSKKKEVRLNTGQFERVLGLGLQKAFYLLDLNDRFIFIEGYGSYDMTHRRITHYIFLLNRHDNNNLFRYFNSDFGHWVIYNNQIASIFYEFLQINEIDGSVERMIIKRPYIVKCIYPTFNYKYVYNLNFKANDYYVLKFYLY